MIPEPTCILDHNVIPARERVTLKPALDAYFLFNLASMKAKVFETLVIRNPGYRFFILDTI